LRDSLEARLDRLAAVKEVAQLGAILGREFSYELLQAISPLDEPTLQHGLSQLVEAELLYQRGLPLQVIYTFKHALIQEAAYQSLLKRTRQEYHQRIAHVLAERFPQLFPVLQGLSTFYIVRAESRTAHELAEELLRLAQRAQDAAMLVAAYSMLGTTSFYLGENASARVHLEQGVALYDPQQHRSHAFLDVGTDPGVLCFIYAAQVLWLLGYPDQALTKSHEALTLAQELSHPFSLAYALDFAALLHRLRREEQAAQERAEAAMTLSTKQGFPLWLAIGMILRGGTLAEQGQGVEGMAQMREGLAVFQATGAAVGRPYFLTVLAEVYGRGGQAEERLSIVDEALAAVQKTGERWWEAELYRLKGVLGLARSGEDYAEAEAYFQHAIDIARLQQAKSLELRAAMSLSRLWQQQGKREETRQLLAEIYGWFTEGFNTADLQEARALLDELS
jgi:predicted ATPase